MKLSEKIDAANKKIKSFNEREVLFKQPITDYQDLVQLEDEFKPYFELWDIASNFKLDSMDWEGGIPFLKLEYKKIENTLNQDYYKKTMQLIKKFEEKEDYNASKVAGELKTDLEKFRENLWLIELLTTEAMKLIKKSASHWQEIFKAAGMNIEDISTVVNDDMKLLKMKEVYKFAEIRSVIEEVSKKAEKQWALEKKLNEMQELVKKIDLDVQEYKKTETYVLILLLL